MASAARWAARAAVKRTLPHGSTGSHVCSLHLLRAACGAEIHPRWISVSTVSFAAKDKKKGASSSPTAEEDSEGAELTAEELDAASNPKDLKTQMTKHVEHAKREFAKLRGATASPSMLDHVRVEAYGEMQSLAGVAQIALKSPILLVVSPFDSALAPAIADAIRDADLNLNPSVDGNIVRVPVPKASKETKEATVKLISKIAESARTRIRRVRQAAMDKLKKADGVSTDLVFRELKDVQAVTNSATEEVVKLAEKKKLEVEAS